MDRIAQRAVATAERALRNAELWSTMASLLGAQYPHLELTTIGSLIGESGWSLPMGDDPTPELADLLAGCRSAHEQATGIRTRALTHIGSHADTNRQGQPVIVFNAAPRPRSGTVWLHVEWPGPGVRGIAVLDEWDRVARPALHDVVRNPDGSIASAWIGWAAKDVPSVGYRTFHLVPESVTPDEPAPGELAPTAPSSQPSPCPTEPPLRVQLASRQTGHLPASFSLLNLQPTDRVGITRISLTADDAIRILLRELVGQHCRVELRLFVPFPDDVQAIELGPRQLVTVTGVAEPPAWAGPGPALSPSPGPMLGPPEGPDDQPARTGATVDAGSVTDLRAEVALPPGAFRLAPGDRVRLPVTITGTGDEPFAVEAVAPCALWPLLPQWRQRGVLYGGTASVNFDLAVPPATAPVDGWIAIRAGRAGRGFGVPQPATVTVTDGTG